MLLEDISGYLNDKVSAEEFVEKIREEVLMYKTEHNEDGTPKKTGSSIPIYLDADDTTLRVNSQHIQKICDDFLSKKLSEWDIYYMCSALDLHENTKFENDKIQDALFHLTDPIVNGRLTPEVAQQIKNEAGA